MVFCALSTMIPGYTSFIHENNWYWLCNGCNWIYRKYIKVIAFPRPTFLIWLNGYKFKVRKSIVSKRKFFNGKLLFCWSRISDKRNISQLVADTVFVEKKKRILCIWYLVLLDGRYQGDDSVYNSTIWNFHLFVLCNQLELCPILNLMTIVTLPLIFYFWIAA